MKTIAKTKTIGEYPAIFGSQLPILPTNFNDKQSGIAYYVKQDLNRLCSMIKINGLPDTMPEREVKINLLTNGHICVTKVKPEDGRGLWAFAGVFGGEFSRYYIPTMYIVSNPTLKTSYELRIHKPENKDYTLSQAGNGECIVIANDSNYTGLLPLLSRYASLMVENDISLRLADINARIAALISGDDDTKASAEIYIKRIIDGEMSIIGDDDFFQSLKVQPYASASYSGIISDLIELQQYLKASKFNDIGLQANYNMKRESLNSTEAQMNNDALLPLVDDIRNCWEQGFNAVNEFYRDELEQDITVDFASSWEIRQKEISNTLDGEEVTENDGEPGDRTKDGNTGIS